MSQRLHHRRITSSLLWLTVFVGFGKLAGAIKESVVAWRFGVGPDLDAYVLLFNLFNWPVAIAFSILTAAMVPVLIATQRNDAKEVLRFSKEIQGLTLLAGALSVAAVWAFGPKLIRIWSGTIDPVLLDHATSIAPEMALLLLIGLYISLLSAWTMACGRHLNTLLESCPALIVILFIVGAHSTTIEALVWGTVAGSLVHATLLAWSLKLNDQLPLPSFTARSPIWHQLVPGIGLIVVGQVLMSISTIIDQFYAVTLGAGALSTLNYANRIVGLVLGLGAIAVSRATLSPFSELASSDAKGLLRTIARKWILILFVLSSIGTLLLAACSTLIVKLLFERGAFTSSDTEVVAKLMIHLSLQAPFYISTLVYTAYFSATRQLKYFAISGLANLVVKLIALQLLIESTGIYALIYSTVVMHVASFLLFTYLFLADRSIPKPPLPMEGRA